MQPKIPLHIVTGFLGVGKTTTILNLLEKLQSRETAAVIVNERGKVGLDGAVLGTENSDIDIREVTGGCICCTAGVELAYALREITERIRPDRIFMEPSGIAKPGEIIDLIIGSDLINTVDLRPVIGIVDQTHFTRPGMMEMPVYRDQVESADILVANRSDLSDNEVRKNFYGKANNLFPPKELIVTTSYGRLPDEVLKLERNSHHAPNDSPTLLQEAKHPHTTHHEHTHASDAKHDLFQEEGWIWPPSKVFGHDNLCELFEEFALNQKNSHGNIVRAKGVFHTGSGWYLYEIALDTFHRRPVQYRRDSRCQVILSEAEDTDFVKLRRRLEACIDTG